MRCVFQPTIAALVVTGLLIAASAPAAAQSGTRTSPPTGSGHRGDRQAPLALKGYCPVGILQMGKWVKGDPAYQVVYDGRTYRFANAQAKKMFEANPAKYVPALGGDCVVALVKVGKRVPGDIRYSAIHDGRLYLFGSAAGKQMFLADPAKYADADLALGGNCPVCASMGHKMPGKPQIAAYYKGLRYLFPSSKMRAMFLANPEKCVSAAKSRMKSSGSATKEPDGSGSSSR